MFYIVTQQSENHDWLLSSQIIQSFVNYKNFSINFKFQVPEDRNVNYHIILRKIANGTL